MADLRSLSNLYANLAEGAYTGRPASFPDKYIERANDTGKSVTIDFQNANQVGKIENGVNVPNSTLAKTANNLPNDGKVYLQPSKDMASSLDNTMMDGGIAEGGIADNRWDPMTNDKTGFNAYLVTDNKNIADSHQAYLTIRGSDSVGNLDPKNFHPDIHNIRTDWIDNDGNFALTNAIIPQAHDAEGAMQSALHALPDGAKLDVTGHSLGTIASSQGVALLYRDSPGDFGQIGHVVLFDGPDITESLRQQGYNDADIERIGKKITYYVNPFDVVSMLNRTGDNQLGTVRYIIPKDFDTTFDNSTDKPSAHDFGELQMKKDGTPTYATKDFHPEFIEAGHKLARLERDTIAAAKVFGLSAFNLSKLMNESPKDRLKELGEQGMELFNKFMEKYNGIIRWTHEQYDAENIKTYRSRLKWATGAERISLENDILAATAEIASFRGQDFTEEVARAISDAKEQIQTNVTDGRNAAHNLAVYLTADEVEEELTEFTMMNFWDYSVEEETNNQAETFRNNLDAFADDLRSVAKDMNEKDRDDAADFENLSVRLKYQ